MIRILYQVGNRRNSSPTLDVGVFLLEEDKKGKTPSVRNTAISSEKIFPVYNSFFLIAVSRILILYLCNCFPEAGYCIYIFYYTHNYFRTQCLFILFFR